MNTPAAYPPSRTKQHADGARRRGVRGDRRGDLGRGARPQRTRLAGQANDSGNGGWHSATAPSGAVNVT